MSLNRIAVIAVLVGILFSPLLSAQPIPGTWDSFVTGSTVFNGALYVFYGDVDTTTLEHFDYYNSSYDGVNWAPTGTRIPIPASLNQTEGFTPVAFNGRLYVFWHGWDWHSIYYISMDQFGVWDTTARRIPNAYASGDNMEAIVFNNRLYVMGRAQDDNTSLFYNSMSTSGTWQFSANARLPTGESTDGPSAAILRGADGVEYLYAFWKDINYNADPMWYSRLAAGSTSWAPSTRLNTSDYPLTDKRPKAVSDGTKIDLLYKGGYSNGLYKKELSTTGTWTQETTLPVSISSAPEAIRFNGATWVFRRTGYPNTQIEPYVYY
jgi:hypothetical protein